MSPRLSAIAAAAAFVAAPRASALSLPAAGVGSLVRRSGGKILVEIRTSDVSAGAVARLGAAGAQVVDVSAEYSTVTAAVAPRALSAIAADPAVRFVQEVLAPQVGSTTTTGPAPKSLAIPHTQCGAATSEGDSLMNVAAARTANNVDGTGQTVGILSDSYNTAPDAVTNAATDVGTGDLPGPGNPCGYTSPVVVQADYAGGGQHDEGRGMAQLVHDLAPGAKLAFATAYNGELDFAKQITNLRTVNQATAIVDDVSYLDEPFFQNGPIANAANLATASGVPYFSAAANSNAIVGGNNVSSYEAPLYRNTTTCPTSVAAFEHVVGCHNFATSGAADSGDQITVSPGGGFGLDLQWAQPWGAVTTDYDVFIVNSAGAIVASSAIDNLVSEQPFEFVGYTNGTLSTQVVRIVIAKYTGATDARLKFVLSQAGDITSVEYHASTGGDIVGPTIYGHNGAALVGSTAAIPFDDSTTPEAFSSRGPVTLYYSNTPSTSLLQTPQVMAKPDFAATDGVRTTFFAQQIMGVWRFYGTSAAAPQAAAIAALVQQDDPALGAMQVIARLRASARPVPIHGAATDVGGGYLDAHAALSGLLPLPGAPRNPVAVPVNAGAFVSWSAPSINPNFPITGYVVTPYLSGVAQAPRVFASPATRVLVTALTNGAGYTFGVVATDVHGSGPSIRTPSVFIGTPSHPSSVIAVPGDAKATVRWTPPASNNGSQVTGYVVTPHTGGAATTPLVFGSSATSETISGLADGSIYSFDVAATNARGLGMASGPAQAIVIGAPTAPGTPTVTAGNGAATVKWVASAANGSAITAYTVTPFIDGVPQPGHAFGATATTGTLTGLTNAHAYSFKVAAINARGAGPRSVATSTIIVGAPAAPTALVATAGPARATLHWTAPTVTNGASITGYVVTVYVAGVAHTTVTFASPATTRIVTALAPGTTYTFAVAAKNSRGAGASSTASNAVTPT